MPDVVFAAQDWLRNPQSVIKHLFDSRGERSDESDDFGTQEHFKSILSDLDCLAQVPLVNSVAATELKPWSLVRFQGMVQDICDKEIYPARFVALNTQTGEKEEMHCLFSDRITLPTDAEAVYDHSQFRERHVGYVVPIPGETSWAKHLRGIAHPEVTQSSSMLGNTSNAKRPREDSAMAVDDAGAHEMAVDATQPTDQLAAGDKKMRSDGAGTDSSEAHSLQVPEELPGACVVKFYDNIDLKLTQVVDIIGVLDLSTTTEDVLDESGEYSAPAASVPRIHCLAYSFMPSSTVTSQEDMARTAADAPAMREALLVMFSEALGGDRDAAEYLLLHMLSYVYVRDTLTGKFSLNLKGVTSDMAQCVCAVIEALVPRCVNIPMTIEMLNTARFAPEKDSATMRVRPGLLQVAKNTNIVVNETVMQTGQLSTQGIENLQALQNVIFHQSLKYGFIYYSMDFEVDNMVLLLSEGKSLLTADVAFRVQPPGDVKPSTATLQSMPEHDLHRLRTYVATMRELASAFVVSEDMQNAIARDYVEMRKEDAQRMTPQLLDTMVTMAKYACLSQGQTTCETTIWEDVKRMEQQRMTRA